VASSVIINASSCTANVAASDLTSGVITNTPTRCSWLANSSSVACLNVQSSFLSPDADCSFSQQVVDTSIMDVDASFHHFSDDDNGDGDLASFSNDGSFADDSKTGSA
jgi:hypothetical protein